MYVYRNALRDFLPGRRPPFPPPIGINLVRVFEAKHKHTHFFSSFEYGLSGARETRRK